MKIIFADMGIEQPVKGRTFAPNLYRNRYCGGCVVYSCWSATGGRRHPSRERFGQVVFGPKSVANTAGGATPRWLRSVESSRSRCGPKLGQKLGMLRICTSKIRLGHA